VRSIAAIANNGTLFTPTILKNNGGAPAVREKIQAKDVDHFRIAREGMRLAVTEGTMGIINVPFVEVAGKSGTAQLGTLKRYVNSWSVGFFPYDKPKYAFAVLMEKGPAANTMSASFAVRSLLDWMAIYSPEYFRE
jgi:penicillin-binding protein 2